MSMSGAAFLQACIDSKVLAATLLGEITSQHSAEDLHDGDRSARFLVERRLLTPFQAREVLAGRGSHLALASYLILDELGQGGMGVVYKALHRDMKREVALKVLSPDANGNPERISRFQREILAAARLAHPHIVTAFDAGNVDGRFFLVMELVPGETLSSYVRHRGALPWPEAVRCVLETAHGLEFAHSQGVWHRDIKPSNLIRQPDGKVRILDLGLARIDDGSALTQDGQTLGTADFMAPEQARDAKFADARSDIYSLGATLWFLLTSRTLFPADSVVNKLLAHQSEPVPNLKLAVPAVPNALAELFASMVAKSPGERPATMREVVLACEELLRTSPSLFAADDETILSPDVTPFVASPHRHASPLPGHSVAPSASAPSVPTSADDSADASSHDVATLVSRKPGERLVDRMSVWELPFRWCPRGSYSMGSPASDSARGIDEELVQVTFSRGLWLAETPVMQDIYHQVLGDNPSHFRGDRRPVDSVTWENAIAFCRELTSRQHRAGLLPPTAAYRLPTEAEWEYACRAGTTSATCFGDALSSTQANFNGDFPCGDAPPGPYRRQTTEVGQYPANPWGFFDLHGNVWEWCQDVYVQRLPGGLDPLVEGNSLQRVVRGGCWNAQGRQLRSSQRHRHTRSLKSYTIGFRIVRTEHSSR
jgi:serine/threonine protein kinase